MLLDKCQHLAVGQHLNRLGENRVICSASCYWQRMKSFLPRLWAHTHVRPVLTSTLAAGNYNNTGWKKSGLLQSELNTDLHAILYSWQTTDSDHSCHLLLECLQLEKGGTRWPCIDIIWQSAGHLLEIQKTIISLTSEEEKGYWRQCGYHGDL